MKLNNRIAVVTGGGRALGRAIALGLANEGADIGLFGPVKAEVEDTAACIRSLNQRVVASVADVSREDQVVAFVKRTELELGPIDILVNNAGIIGPTAPVENVSRSDWDDVIGVNLTGPFLCAKAVVPSMVQRRGGKIINISSIVGKKGYALRAPYCVSKWGVIGLTLTLAQELGPHNIQVNAICPGPVDGERMQTLIQRRAEQQARTVDEVKREYLASTLLGRMVSEDDVAAMVTYLASPRADNITGQAIDVSAGYGLT